MTQLRSMRMRTLLTAVVTATVMISPGTAAWSQIVDQQMKASIVARGKYLAQAGDCVACHTAPGGKLFAGARAMPTPFATLFPSNLPPDTETGIDHWKPYRCNPVGNKGARTGGRFGQAAMPARGLPT